jgi:hypothetical protein
MATYTLISSNVLTSSAASVTFSAIPATYTDLVLRASVRCDFAATVKETEIIFNADTATNYSFTNLLGLGSNGDASQQFGTQAYGWTGKIAAASSTSDTFANVEIYIPSYTASQNKPFSSNNMNENNNTIVEATAGVALLWRNTAAITSILFYPRASNFVSGSSFYLYGISNA